MPSIIVDGITYTVSEGKNLLEAVLSQGIDLPYFCWHPALGSVGACRQCAVVQYKDEHDTKGRIVMACMTPASDGTRISVGTGDARAFRAEIIEWLMVNHPHDCPVCDEGGECHLQDMTLMSGHNYRAYRFTKRTHRNQDLGPFINHEMNRCITCYRCVRYYRDYAGGNDLDAFAAHDHVYFGRQADGPLENEFSGNLVEVCPTGVFTDKTLGQHYTRKWDLQMAPSVCVHCSVGCNTIAGERYGMLRRISTRYNREVNGYFLCDRGRFGYEFVNSALRLRKPEVRDEPGGPVRDSTPAEALKYVKKILASGKPLIGIGSPRASLESNYALLKIVGKERFYSGLSSAEQKLCSKILAFSKDGPVRAASLHEIEQADAVLILGEDITNTAPMMALAVRQAARNRPIEASLKMGIPRWNDAALRELIQKSVGPVYQATAVPTRLQDISSRSLVAAPDNIARFGLAIAHAISPEMPDVPGLLSNLSTDAEDIAAALVSAKNPVVISGTSLLNEAIVDAAAKIAWALHAAGKTPRLSFALAECNTMGSVMLGGKDLDQLIGDLRQNRPATLVILENDLYHRMPRQLADDVLNAGNDVIVLDALHTPTSVKALVAVPASSFAEGDGTLVNYEGRAQRFFQVINPNDVIQESWRWVRDFFPEKLTWESLDDVILDLAATFPHLRGVVDAAPPATFTEYGRKAARQPHRYSGRTSMQAHISIHEQRPPGDADAPMRFSMEGFPPGKESSLITYFWAPGWNSIQSTNLYQREIGGLLTGGTPGAMLISPSASAKPDVSQGSVPPAYSASGEILLVPRHQIFGSEELSAHASALSLRIDPPSVLINPQTAGWLGISEGQEVTVSDNLNSCRMKAVMDNAMPEGIAAVSVVPGTEGLVMPVKGKVGK